jgi:hypothetical protein
MYIGFQFTLYVYVENMMVFFYCILGELVFFSNTMNHTLCMKLHGGINT